MIPLADRLLARIAQDGPVALSIYMAECLFDPTDGYYTTREPFGVSGDFVTAPEISQMFGELVGLALAQSWMDQGAPADCVLAELGPGRGTLMADILRATRAVPGFKPAVHLVEASQRLRDIQGQTLADWTPVFHDTAETLPDKPTWLVANEFFDALPIRQFVREGDAWRERLVGAADGQLTLGLGAPLPVDVLRHRLADTRDGDIVELCPSAGPIAARIGARITDHGGAALIIDYGDWRSLGDTLQALQDGKPADPLAAPGRADLTAHVDFEALSRATPSAYSRVTPQGIWLERLGITARTKALAQNLSGAALDSHIAAHRRLTHPDEMGTVFKVMGFHPPSAPPIPGLEP